MLRHTNEIGAHIKSFRRKGHGRASHCHVLAEFLRKVAGAQEFGAESSVVNCCSGVGTSIAWSMLATNFNDKSREISSDS